MASVLESVLAQFTPDVSRMISRQLGVDQQTVQTAITLAIPILIAALARNSSDPQGASSLTNALEQDHDGAILNDVPGAVRDYQSQPGEGILKHVLGDQEGEVSEVLTKTTGVDGATILQMLAPVVMGVLGSMQRQEHLDATGVATTLGQEREQIVKSEGPLVETALTQAGRPPDAATAITDLLQQFLR